MQQQREYRTLKNYCKRIDRFCLEPKKFKNFLLKNQLDLYYEDDTDEYLLFLIDVVDNLQDIFINGIIDKNRNLIKIPLLDFEYLLELFSKHYGYGSTWSCNVNDYLKEIFYERLDNLKIMIEDYINIYNDNVYQVLQKGFNCYLYEIPGPIFIKLNNFLELDFSDYYNDNYNYAESKEDG